MTKPLTMAWMALIFLLSCSSGSFIEQPILGGENGSLLQEMEVDDTYSLLQVQLSQQEDRLSSMARGRGDQQLKPKMQSNTQLLYKGLIAKSDDPLMPVNICILVMAFLLILMVVHKLIDVAFHNVPFLASLSMLCLLAVFCSTILPMMLSSPEKVLLNCGTWVLFSSYMSILILMFTPLILIMPEPSTSLMSYYVLGSSEAETYSPKVRGNQRKLSILFLLILVFQVASGVSIFFVCEFDAPSSQTGDIAGPAMIVFVYGILAWCSLFVIYERMFPLRSFAADFPGLILTQAFMNRSRWKNPDSTFQGRLSAMKAAVEKMSAESNATPPAVKEFCRYMSSAIMGMESDILLQGTGITDELAFVKGAIDDSKLGKWTHYILWCLYGIACLVFAIWMGVQLGQAVTDHEPKVRAMLWILVGTLFFFLLLVVLLEIIMHEGAFGGMSSGPDGKAEHEETSGAKLFGFRDIHLASTTSPYLQGLLGLQSEIEKRIAERTGQSSPETIASKSDLANVLFKRQDFEAAEKLYREVWEAKKIALGPDNSDTLLSKENLANAVLWCGDSATAETLYREVLETRTRIFGSEHPETLSTKYRLERCTEKIL